MPESRDRLVRTARWPFVFSSNLFERPCMQEAPITAAIRIQREGSVHTTGNVYRGQGGRNLWWMRTTSASARVTPGIVRRNSIGGRGANSMLPSWYPRTPLRDITTVAWAYDGRRRLSRLRDGCKDSEVITEGCSCWNVHTDSFSPVKHGDASVFTTPYQPSGITGSCKQSACEILLDAVNMKSDIDSEFLTPQRKLLNEIDTVREVVLDGIRQFNETPLAKRAERKRKVRVLMSIR